MKIKLIGIDPSLRNFGYASAIYDTDTGEVEIVDLNLVESKPADKATKKKIRQNCLDLEDAKEQQRGLIAYASGHQLAIAEVPVGSQSARSMASYGICVGVLSSCPVPLIPVTPTEVKKAGYGVASATKEEQIEWATTKHPNAPWLRVKKTQALLGKNEHMADAVACLYAGIKTPEFQQAVALMQAMNA